MSIQFDSSRDSAILSGAFGLQKASEGITQNSINIAQRQAQLREPQDVLADAALQQVSAVKQQLPQGGDSLTEDIVGLSLNLRNAQANSKVLEVVKDTVGRLIDEVV